MSRALSARSWVRLRCFQAQVHVRRRRLPAGEPGRIRRGGSDLDGRAAETSRPDRRASIGRSPTINAGASTALSLREKTSAANDGHPHEGMSCRAEQPTSLSSTMSQFPARRHFPRFIRPREREAEQEGHQDRAAEAGLDREGTSRVQRASHFGDPFFSRQQWAARGAHRQLIPLGYARP